jgi:quinol monooxygenase YgiN
LSGIADGSRSALTMKFTPDFSVTGNVEKISVQPQKYPSKIMQYVLIIHEVENYAAWKQVFDRAADIRKVAGERTYQVLKYENDPNKIVHFSAWTTIDAAKQFFESPELVKIRAEAGVKSPEFIYLEQVDSGTL